MPRVQRGSERWRAVSGDSASTEAGFDAQRLIRPAGDRAFLVTASIPGIVTALRARAIVGVRDVLPAAETVLVTLDSVDDAQRVRDELETLLRRVHSGPGGDVRGTARAGESFESAGEPVLIEVHYDGADLAEVARLLDMSVSQVVAAHTGTVWHCGFIGFAPGFGYLESPDGRLNVPRREQARTVIPAGAVALAGGYSAVYPRGTPGGWRLIGHTEAPLWDIDRDPPALIRAGTAVRFIEVAR
ncbi:allophanate hydrolase subunit 1 [Nocardia sp. NPDC005366]|uniref:5-oxoprolinase subunit B family protein n=1 Tax=Nocardia sp. NPDC005366 TaxID=3156878 RepID=UPI0033AE358A